MTSEYNLARRSKAEFISMIEERISPDVFIVTHLNRSSDGQRGNRQAYESAVVRVLASLSERIYGKIYWRRKPGKRLIPNAVTLEKADEWPHLNFLIRKPDEMPFQAFETMFIDEWSKCPWSKWGKGDFWCQEREAGSGACAYIIKEGAEALLERSLTFWV